MSTLFKTAMDKAKIQALIDLGFDPEVVKEFLKNTEAVQLKAHGLGIRFKADQRTPMEQTLAWARREG